METVQSTKGSTSKSTSFEEAAESALPELGPLIAGSPAAEWDTVETLLKHIQHYVPVTLPGKPRSLFGVGVDGLREMLAEHRAGHLEPYEKGDRDREADKAAQRALLADWSNWRVDLTSCEAQNASKLAAILDCADRVKRLREQHAERTYRSFEVAHEEISAFLRAQYRIKRVPEEASKRQRLARKACVCLDVMPNEWRDPEWREVTE